MKKLFLIAILLLYATAQAEDPSGAMIIKKVDKNMSSETRVVTSKMIIHSRRDTRTVQSKSWT